MIERLINVAVFWAGAFFTSCCLTLLFGEETRDWRWFRYSIIALILSLATASVAYIGQGHF